MSRKLIALLSAAAAVVAMLATFWALQRPGAAAPPAPGALTFRGTLAHNWNGPVSGACDFRFQLYDAELNGAPVGAPVEVRAVPVANGQVTIPLAAGQLRPAGAAPTWLAIEVRCPARQGGYAALGPRLQHHGAAAAAGAAGDWQIPQRGALVCALPGAPDAANAQHPSIPALYGVEYRLTGGFYAG
jgi:hypothetical protein